MCKPSRQIQVPPHAYPCLPVLCLVCSVDVDVVLSSLTLLTWDEMGFVKRSGHHGRGELNKSPVAGTC